MPIPVHTSNEKPSTSETNQPTTEVKPSTMIPDQVSQMGQAGSSAAQQTKSEVEQAADKLYEERIEEEYAKREGGA